MASPTLKKRWGQHHLRDGDLCRPLLRFLDPAGARVVEIGPGGGVLTERLLAAGARVLACEVDPEWAFHLHRRLPAAAVAVFDALDLDWSRLRAPVLAAGNLPFQVATRLIEQLLPHAAVVERAAFMVQKEVAERLVAVPGEPAYGSLSVLAAAQASVRYLGTVAPGSFRPPPKVAAAFVGFELRPPPFPPERLPAFTGLVRLAFAQRRKTLRNALAAGWGRERAEAVLAAVGLDRRCRAESLPLATFVALLEALEV
jgi:16S rRNA (adenine1518-N6/adenine1519-N6)-dimethyltransferase